MSFKSHLNKQMDVYDCECGVLSIFIHLYLRRHLCSVLSDPSLALNPKTSSPTDDWLFPSTLCGPHKAEQLIKEHLQG